MPDLWEASFAASGDLRRLTVVSEEQTRIIGSQRNPAVMGDTVYEG